MQLTEIDIHTKKVFVFDWDGTILDSMAIKQKNFSETIANQIHQIQSLDNRHSLTAEIELTAEIKQIYASLSGNPRKEIFYMILDQLHIKHHLVSFQDFSFNLSLANQESLQQAKIFTDAKNLLDRLIKSRKKIFISSSTPQLELDFLVKSHLNTESLQSISSVLGSADNFTKGKNHLEYIAKQSGYGREDILVIGDDLADFELSLAAGVNCILVDRSKRFSDVPHVHSLDCIFHRSI
jgi:phosphoglycolate phosphatase-like HAD superfamily hydrolase